MVKLHGASRTTDPQRLLTQFQDRDGVCHCHWGQHLGFATKLFSEAQAEQLNFHCLTGTGTVLSL